MPRNQPTPSHSSHALRGDYSKIRADHTVEQPFAQYSAAEHDRWRRLYRRQMALMPRYAVQEFTDSVESLGVADGIPDFARVQRDAGEATGFQIVAVPGLIPDAVFFDHLANRRFPVSWWLREDRSWTIWRSPMSSMISSAMSVAGPQGLCRLHGRIRQGRAALQRIWGRFLSCPGSIGTRSNSA